MPGYTGSSSLCVQYVEDEKTTGVSRAEFRRPFSQLTLIEIVQTITLISFNLFNGPSSRPCRISHLIFLIKTHAVATCLLFFTLNCSLFKMDCRHFVSVSCIEYVEAQIMF
jgi:hypothetical protein